MDDRTFHVSAEDTQVEDVPADALDTISAAADRAGPGDEIVVHGGTYRERIDPPRGGTSPEDRIVYRAAAGDTVVVKGSEPVEGWEPVGDGVWSVTLAADVFGEYNPFAERIRGDWFDDMGRDHHTGAVYVDGAALPEAESRAALEAAEQHRRSWYAETEGSTTTIWARFDETEPETALIEVNVRPAVFYPSEPGRDYITVEGFTLRHAATQWAPPTTEQIGLLGTHWSKGWVVANNEISHSRCTGISLGKYGPSVDETGESAQRYNETIEAAIANGWERGNVGHHVVRNNEIHHCEQAGIVGSMGGAFSTIEENHIHDINLERQFKGWEVAGIKFHGAVDSTIAGNCIHRSRRGLWLDWMTQGTRITGNLCFDNTTDDVFLEVNHGPFVLDNNVLLSETALYDRSQGGAYVHNLLAGRVKFKPEPDRSTPYLKPRSTEVAGLSAISGGDNRFYNNVFSGGTGLAPYDEADGPVVMGGNVYLGDATPGEAETDPLLGADPVTVTESDDSLSLSFPSAVEWAGAEMSFVTTHLLGSATLPDAPFTEPDGTTLRVDRDYSGSKRETENPTPGPFETPTAGRLELSPR